MIKRDRREYNKIYRETHKEERRIYDKNYREKHKEERSIYNKMWYRTHKEEKNSSVKEYRKIHKKEFRDYQKEYREDNKEKIREYQRSHYIKNKERIDEYRRRWRRSKSGVLNVSGESKKGVCPICLKKNKKLHWDHDHKTKEMRGWICAGCNLALGKFGDNIQGLERALEYLKKFRPKDEYVKSKRRKPK